MSKLYEKLWHVRQAETIADQRLALEQLVMEMAAPSEGFFNTTNDSPVDRVKPKLYSNSRYSVYNPEFAKIFRHGMRARTESTPILNAIFIKTVDSDRPDRKMIWVMNYKSEATDFDDPAFLRLNCSSQSSLRRYENRGSDHITENPFTKKINGILLRTSYDDLLGAMEVYEGSPRSHDFSVARAAHVACQHLIDITATR